MSLWSIIGGLSKNHLWLLCSLSRLIVLRWSLHETESYLFTCTLAHRRISWRLLLSAARNKRLCGMVGWGGRGLKCVEMNKKAGRRAEEWGLGEMLPRSGKGRFERGCYTKYSQDVRYFYHGHRSFWLEEQIGKVNIYVHFSYVFGRTIFVRTPLSWWLIRGFEEFRHRVHYKWKSLPREKKCEGYRNEIFSYPFSSLF